MSIPPVSENHAFGLHIQLLGEFKVQVDGIAIPDGQWKSSRARNLIKLLALSPSHWLHREQVIDTLWPKSTPSAAANNLHQTLYAARHSLEPRVLGCLNLQEGMLSLSGGEGRTLSVDVDQFEAAALHAKDSKDLQAYQSALALYSGELLPKDRYQEWTIRRREALQHTYLQLLLNLAQLQESLSNYPTGIETLQRLLAVDPCHEDAHTSLMRLYALSGQRQLALAQFENLKKILQRELKVEPSEETLRLYASIRDKAVQPAGEKAPKE
jgi:DNA-binding SARP family transcriptional activator